MTRTRPEPAAAPAPAPGERPESTGEYLAGVRLPSGLPRRSLAALRVADINPRLHAPAQIDALVRSIREYGFLVPVVVDADGKLLAGHARLLAAARIGLPAVPYVDATHLSPLQRQAYLVADNQLAVAASWDETTLGALLIHLQTENAALLDTLGFTPQELDALCAVPEPPETFRSYDETVETRYQCPQCGFEWSGEPKPGRLT